MGLRVSLVTPFAWSRPHDVNDHVGGLARALRALGHEVTVLAPSHRARDLREGRRSLRRGSLGEVVAVGPAVPLSPRNVLALPVGLRANLALALEEGRFDVVHGFEPGLPSLSYVALRESTALGVATFLSPGRLRYPPGKAQRDRFVGRVDALLATSQETAAAAAARFAGDYTLVPGGVDLELFRPSRAVRRRIVVEVGVADRKTARSVVRTLDDLVGWDLVLLQDRARPRPYVPLRLRERVHVRVARDARSRAVVLSGSAIFVPAGDGVPQRILEASASGVALATPDTLPALARDEAGRSRAVRAARAEAEPQGYGTLAAEVGAVYAGLAARRRRRRPPAAPPPRASVVCDLHTHTSWSHDCSTEPGELLDEAERLGLGAIAITDHNVFGGALEAVELARRRRIVVIPGEEVKTAGQGEVIGLFLREEIPRGMAFDETVTAIREQGGLVYVPHPFDRRHAIPSPATLHRHLAEIDILEVYNARLLLEAYNDEALRFARKYDLLMGAGSDAHVLPGLGTGAVRMPAFRTAEEFLIALRNAEILRRPKSLAYLQSLKWVAQVRDQVKEKVR